MTQNDNAFDALTPETLKSAAASLSKRTGRKIVLHAPQKAWYRAVRLSSVFQYLLFLGGLAAITAGCYMIYRPLGPLVGGLIAVSLGMLLSSDSDELSK